MNMRKYINMMEDVTEAPPLPEDVIIAFEQLGDLQRGIPENAMLRVQHIMGGGVLNPVVEHVGDITHRMSHLVRHGAVLGREKVIKTLKWLSHRYGFEREMNENILNNAKAMGIPPEQLHTKLTQALRVYAQAHEKLPVYNRAQWLAREAAVSIGYENFDHARSYLQALAAMADTEDQFAQNAMRYTKDEQGHLLQYVPGKNMA